MEITCPDNDYIAAPVIDKQNTYVAKGKDLYNELIKCTSESEIIDKIKNYSDKIYPSDNIDINDDYITIVGIIVNNGDINGTYGFTLSKNNTEIMPIVEEQSPVIAFFDYTYIYGNDKIELKVFKCKNGNPVFTDNIKWIFNTPKKENQPSQKKKELPVIKPVKQEKPKQQLPGMIFSCNDNKSDTTPNPKIIDAWIKIDDEKQTEPGVYKVRFGKNITIGATIKNEGNPGYARIDILVNNSDISQELKEGFEYMSNGDMKSTELSLSVTKPMTIYVYSVVCDGNKMEPIDDVGPFQVNPEISISYVINYIKNLFSRIF